MCEVKQGSVTNLKSFLNNSPTSYHASEQLKNALKKAGFTELKEQDAWVLNAGGTYFVRRGLSSLVAFRLGIENPIDAGFVLAGAHTDSPGLKIKGEKNVSDDGTMRGPVEVYGGPILSSWLDRELGLAGVVSVVNHAGVSEYRLYNSNRPIAIIPNIAIHLNREINKGFEYNRQTHLQAIFSSSACVSSTRSLNQDESSAAEYNQEYLLGLLSRDLQVASEEIHRGELFLYDPQECNILEDSNFIVSGRLDDLAMCHAIMTAITTCGPSSATQIGVFFDNEECGSRTYRGAASNFLSSVMDRIGLHYKIDDEGRMRARARSFFMSADAAHAFHPSYPDKYDKDYTPLLNHGPVLKINANQNYATSFDTADHISKICREHEIPLQEYIIRSDLRSGGTIGALSAASLGIATVDIGNPLWAMHSIRETAGTLDHHLMIDLLRVCFAEWHPKD